jgi:hypothetical protein
MGNSSGKYAVCCSVIKVRRTLQLVFFLRLLRGILLLMKIIVTHTSPDWDAIGSVWLLKRYLPGWAEASVEFVPAGQRRVGSVLATDSGVGDPIEKVGEDEVIHVDTGLGPLDHHQTGDKSISGAGLVWRFILKQVAQKRIPITESDKWEDKKAAIGRVVSFIVETDHFKEVFWAEPAADYHEFTLLGLLDGLKLLKPEQDDYYVVFGTECLEAMLHTFENRIWAEREIESATRFETKWGQGLAFDTINDSVLKLAQKMGYVLVVRKDPRKGYVRIKVKPADDAKPVSETNQDIDLTPVYEALKEKDPAFFA